MSKVAEDQSFTFNAKAKVNQSVSFMTDATMTSKMNPAAPTEKSDFLYPSSPRKNMKGSVGLEASSDQLMDSKVMNKTLDSKNDFNDNLDGLSAIRSSQNRGT